MLSMCTRISICGLGLPLNFMCNGGQKHPGHCTIPPSIYVRRLQRSSAITPCVDKIPIQRPCHTHYHPPKRRWGMGYVGVSMRSRTRTRGVVLSFLTFYVHFSSHIHNPSPRMSKRTKKKKKRQTGKQANKQTG